MAPVKTKFGRLDALLNIAGGFQWETLEDGKAESWDHMYALNLKTALFACQGALPYLLESGAGRIVDVGAKSALEAASGFGPYAASKSAVHRLTESLADELKLKGVTVNAVLPSIIDTPANRRDMPKADFDRWVSLGRPCGGHAVPGVRRGQGRHRRADLRLGPGVAPRSRDRRSHDRSWAMSSSTSGGGGSRR